MHGNNSDCSRGIGENYDDLTTVEVLNFENSQWSTAVELPESLFSCSAVVRGDQLYMLGDGFGWKSVYTCSVSALLQTCTQKSSLERTSALSLSNSNSSNQGVWSKLTDLPVRDSTCVTFVDSSLQLVGEILLTNPPQLFICTTKLPTPGVSSVT